jgi:serine protease Do
MHLDVDDGVIIADVQKSGPADRAGLKRGDVVTDVDGKPVESSGHFRNTIGGAGAKKTVQLGFVRDGKRQTMSVVLGELPNQDAADAVSEPASPGDQQVEGLALKSLTPELRSRLRVPEDVNGVVIVRVEPGSRAAAARLQPGDVVTAVNQKPVTNPADVQKQYSGKGAQLFSVVRQGQRSFIVVK